MCVKDGTEKCDDPEKHVPCGWCLMMAACPQAIKAQKERAQRSFE
jgi:hypothetical protein